MKDTFINQTRTLMRNFSYNRVETIVNLITGSLRTTGTNNFDVIYNILQRINIIESMSAIVKYRDQIGLVPSDPNFLLDFLISPITSIVPRIVLPIKSFSDYGLWVTQNVHGDYNIFSSSYVTLQGFFYLAGGVFMVILGFFLLGLILRITDGMLNIYNKSIITIPIYLILIYQVVFEPSNPVSFVSDIVRGMIIFFIFMKIFTKRKIAYDDSI